MAKTKPKWEGRSVAKDISGSLGKLPPQALDMEEAVIGAILSEKPALDRVVSFLKPDHFYHEYHKLIYEAVIAIHGAKEPVDIRTVRHQLTKTGHLELIGGAYKLADLTSKVSSSANIESHARIIVEMAMKREIIQIASRIHADAYEDTQDVFELLDASLSKITELKDNETGTSGGQNMQEIWDDILIKKEPPPDIPLIKIGNELVASIENVSLIIGKKKSRKTLFLILLIQWALEEGNLTSDEILIFDTEQGHYHVYQLREKIKKTIGNYVDVFFLKGKSHNERKDIIRQTVDQWPVPPKLIIIDGIRDLMLDINNTEESSELIQWMNKITSEHSVHIINVLHQNKTDKNPRGHIGTELQNKAQTIIELEIDPKNNVTIVKCEAARDKLFDTFAFTHGHDGMPEIIGTPTGNSVLKQEDRKKILIGIFQDGPLKYKELCEEIRLEFKVSKHKAEQLIREFNRNGWIVKSGKRGDPTAMYKIMAGEDTPPAPQPELFPQNGTHISDEEPDWVKEKTNSNDQQNDEKQVFF